MDPIIFEYIREAIRRVYDKLYWILGAMAAVSFVVLIFGANYQPKFETSITIYADNQNVIKPLLEGQTAVTTPKSERIRVVQEIMFGTRLLEEVVRDALGLQYASGSKNMEDAIADLRSDVTLASPANDYVSISFAHERADVSYQVVNKITNLFIEESAKAKRSESKSAFTFIDEQVKSYKSQLVEAENKLKSFEAANIDGVESQVANSINRLQLEIDEIAIDIEAEVVKIDALEEQLKQEDRYASSDYNARVYRERLSILESQLDTLRLNYRDEHPDVVDIRLQIQDLKKTIVEVENASQSPDVSSTDLTGERRLNPIFEELTNQLAEARVNVQTMRHRLAANQKRLDEQFKRRIRVASNQAELSELTRDYDVTKQIYEDLLERKERARISMTLDLAGQGVTYKILEPAVFPVLPTGLRFLHFVVVGPIVGLALPICLIIALMFLDHRIKFASQLNDAFPGIVLAVVPNNERSYWDWRYLSASVAGYAGLYAGSALLVRFVL